METLYGYCFCVHKMCLYLHWFLSPGSSSFLEYTNNILSTQLLCNKQLSVNLLVIVVSNCFFVNYFIITIWFHWCTQLLSQDSEECNKAMVLTVAHALHITGTFAIVMIIPEPFYVVEPAGNPAPITMDRNHT